MKGILEYKSIAAEVKDIDTKQGIVTGYFSSFGNKDFDNDIIVKGAYAKTIAERGPQGSNEIFYLNQHNWDQPLGRPYLLQEDEKGLYFESKVTTASFGKDALILYAEGLVKEHSVGFITVKADRENDVRVMKELYLYEGSAVTLGANNQTPFTGFKYKSLIESNKDIKSIVKLLRNGELTDETFTLLEIALKQLQKEAYELGKKDISVEQSQPDKPTEKEGNPNVDFKTLLFKTLSQN